MFALPIIVIEALQLQMKEVIEKEAKSRTPTMNQAGLVALAKSVEQSCSELSSFSRLCRLLQKFSLSKSDIAEIDSAPPMERTIGNLKQHIKSRKQPASNAFSAIKKQIVQRSADEQAMMRGIGESRISYKSQYYSLVEISWQHLLGRIQIKKITSYFPTMAGQTLKFTRTSSATAGLNNVIFAPETSDVFCDELIPSHQQQTANKKRKLGSIRMMYNDGVNDLALIQVYSPISLNQFGANFFNKEAAACRTAIIHLKSVVSYAILMPFLASNNKNLRYILWRE
ncbi:hypothetical protein G6F42_024793 [Rhizopus arrhizus]|nr:hypothetical protein G6F42_024793 [Rhizopus arrhizus]